MHVSHLGDTNDLAKRPLMEVLAPIDEWVVVPMFEGEWSQENIRRYKRIVGAQVSSMDILGGGQNREGLLSTLGYDGPVYFDPTTGVKRPEEGSQNSPKHVRVDELARETTRRPSSLTLVYDQSAFRGESAQDALIDKMRLLRDQGVRGLGYVAQAPHLVLSCDADVIEQACADLLDAGIRPDRIVNC